MVCLEIVDLLPEENCPEIFAQEFDYVEVIGKTRTVARESFCKTLSNSIPERLKAKECRFPDLLVIRLLAIVRGELFRQPLRHRYQFYQE